MNMLKKELTIVVQKEINNYLHNAYFLSIILGYDNLKNWFYENYVQLYFNGDKFVRNTGIPEYFLDFYGGWTEPRKFFDSESYYRREINPSEIISLVKEKIGNDCYVYTYVDEFITKENVNVHNAHDILVYGYNDEKQEFMVLGFDDKNNFNSYKISYDNFERGYASGVENSQVSDMYQGKNYFFTMKMNVNEDYQYDFHVEIFLNYLKEYVNCINTGMKCEDPNGDMYKCDSIKYGIQVYDELLPIMEKIIEKKEIIDYRVFHTLYEHKTLMHKRLQYMANIIPIDNKAKEDILNQSQNLAGIAQELRLNCIKYNLCRRETVMRMMIDQVNLLKNIETTLYPKVFQWLESV